MKDRTEFLIDLEKNYMDIDNFYKKINLEIEYLQINKLNDIQKLIIEKLN